MLVATIVQVNGIKQGEGAVLSSTLGMRKRALLVEQAKKKGVEILNIDTESFLKEVSDEMAKRKTSQKKSKKVEPKKEEAKKEEKKEAKEQVKESVPEKIAERDSEEQKKREKEEKDKILTKRV